MSEETVFNREQSQRAVYENRKALKEQGLTLPKNKTGFNDLTDEEIQSLESEISETPTSVIDDVQVSDVTGVTKQSTKTGEVYYTTPCEFAEYDGVNAYFTILHGTHAGRRLCVNKDKDIYLLNLKTPIPAGTVMHFGYIHGKESFKFLDRAINANSVCFSNRDEDNLSLGRLIKDLSPELFRAGLEIATAVAKEDAKILFENSIIYGVKERALRLQRDTENMELALKKSREESITSRKALLGL
jgi:hypothetical protein